MNLNKNKANPISNSLHPDMSFSMMVDERGQLRTTDSNQKNNQRDNQREITPLQSIEPRKIHTWVKDEVVTNCYRCNRQFTFYHRRHHCRVCLRIFCYKCSDYWMKIPECLRHNCPESNFGAAISTTLNTLNPLTIYTNYQGSNSSSNKSKKSPVSSPKSPKQVGNSPQSTLFIDTYLQDREKSPSPQPELKNQLNKKKVRVCFKCYKKLSKIRKLEALIETFKLLDLDIKDWKTISQVSHTWRQIANYNLSRFREIQYYLPGKKLTKEDRKTLWINRKYLVGHSLWTIQLLRSIDYENYEERTQKLEEIIDLLDSSNKREYIIREPDIVSPRVIRPSSENNMPSLWLDVDMEYRTNFNKSNSSDSLQDLRTDFCNLLKVDQEKEKKRKKGHFTTTIELKEFEVRQNKLRKIRERAKLTIKNKKFRLATCWKLMCSRDCKPFIRPEDAISLLDHTIQSKPIRELSIEYLSLANNTELRCYIPLLVHYMRYESVESSVIGDFIIERCITPIKECNMKFDAPDDIYLVNEENNELDAYFVNDVYWQLKLNLESKAYFQIYKHFLDKFCNKVPKDLLDIIFRGQHTVNLLESLPKNVPEEQIVTQIRRQINSETIPYLTLPTEPFLDYFDIDAENVHKKTSATEPLIIPFKYHNNNQEEKTYQILYKAEDVRKDQIIMKIIQLMDQILKKEEGLDLNIVTYEVKPTNSRSGLIQIVPDCATMYHIKEKIKFSVLNYIIENNPEQTVERLRAKFLKSCAAYCVITYLLGIGDRHLDNIMVTKEGVIFHIDYGFILGFDPKPMTSPKMRIDPDMVDALGGVNSQYYKEFKTLSNRIYNCLRRHVNIFINMLSLLIEVDPPIENRINFTRAILMQEVMKRFIPGENHEIAELQLLTQIDKSSSNYGQVLNDFFHYHAKENTLQTTICSTYKGTKTVLNGIYKLFGS